MNHNKIPTDHKPCMSKRWAVMGLLAGVLPQWACSQHDRHVVEGTSALMSPEDAALRHRFRGVRGGEKRIDAVQSMSGVALYLENGWVFASGSFGQNPKISSYGGGVPGDELVVPKTLRMVLYGPGSKRTLRDNEFGAYEGKIVNDVTVPVASRIPEDLLEDLRRDPKGGLRLKLRILPEKLLVGWDIERRPGFDKKKLDVYGEAVYVAPVHSFAGGDFREAKIFNGQVIRKGWYIDPKSSERIETDF